MPNNQAPTGASQLQTLAQLMQLFNGGGSQTSTTTTSGGERTTQTQLTDEAMQRLLQQILEGNGGVRTITGAARGAGLYNSSTEEQLLNDLYTRAAGEVAARAAPTVETVTPQTQTTRTRTSGGMNIGETLLGLGVMGLGNALFNSEVVSNAGNAVGGWLSNLFGLNSGSGAGAANPISGARSGNRTLQDFAQGAGMSLLGGPTTLTSVAPGQLGQIGGELNTALNFINTQGAFTSGFGGLSGPQQNVMFGSPAYQQWTGQSPFNFSGGLPSLGSIPSGNAFQF